MVVSVFQVFIDVPGLKSIKEKRRIVLSLKDRLIRKYKLSVAEVDHLDSLKYINIGAAIVSNSKKYGESVLNKLLNYIEDNVPGRILEKRIFSEMF